MPKYFYLIIIFSFLLGVISFFAPGFIFCLILTISIFWIIYKKTPIEERRYIFTALVVAYVLRLAVFIFINYYLFSKGLVDIFGDGVDNLLRGHMLGDFLAGRSQELPIVLTPGTYNAHLITIFNGFFFALFRNDIVSLKYLNILFAMVLAWFVYDLTRNIYNFRSAKVAFTIVLFWPNLLICSVTGLKEIHFILAIIAMLWSIERFSSKNSFGSKLIFLFLAILFGICVALIRFPFRPILLFYGICVFAYFLIHWFFKISSHKIVRTIVFSIASLIFIYMFRRGIYQQAKNIYELGISLQRGFLTSGGINYDLIGDAPNIYSFKFMFRYVFGSLFHFLMEPLPGKFLSLRLIVFWLLMLFWYPLLFLSVLGAINIYRIDHGHKIAPVLIFLFLYIFPLAMSIANIGTAIRCRDAMLPILAMLASCCFMSPLVSKTNK